MALISVTRLRLRSPLFLPPFLVYAVLKQHLATRSCMARLPHPSPAHAAGAPLPDRAS